MPKLVHYAGGGALAALLLLTLGFQGYVLHVYHKEGNVPLPAMVGNFLPNRQRLAVEPPRQEFSFAVVGDTQSLGTFQVIADELRDEPLSFAVILGDFVRDGTEGYHRYFRAECAREYRFPYPTFLIVGNHDVEPARFPIKRFEEVYGPTVFSLEYQGCLFVFLRILDVPHSNDESLDLLRRLVADGAAARYRHKFIFMHVPPDVSPDYAARKFKESDELVSLAEQMGADYVIGADYHGYARVQRGRTTYLVSGGGGAYLKTRKFGRFYHTVVLAVGKDHVSERILAVPHTRSWEDGIEQFALAQAQPWLAPHGALAGVLDAAGTAVLLAIPWRLAWLRRRWRRQASRPG